jgi:hypothetical protein
MKRLAVVASQLARKFPGIVVHQSYARLGTEKYSAVDFTEDEIKIRNSFFNIAAAIRHQNKK